MRCGAARVNTSQSQTNFFFSRWEASRLSSIIHHDMPGSIRDFQILIFQIYLCGRASCPST
jgi:hypothetical protein